MTRWIPAVMLLAACAPADRDGDGFESPEDCDDNAANINPDAFDVRDNGVDEDCDGQDRPPLRYVGDWVVTSPPGVSGRFAVRSTLTVTLDLEFTYPETTWSHEANGNISEVEGDDRGFDFELDGTTVGENSGAVSGFSQGQCAVQGQNLVCAIAYGTFWGVIDVANPVTFERE
jgi:hypothetical protein